MKAWTHRELLTFLRGGSGLLVACTLAFLGLAIAILVLGGPWYFIAAYVTCAGVTGALAWKARPSGPVRQPPPTAAEQARRARRSGNPAVRAEAERADGDHG